MPALVANCALQSTPTKQQQKEFCLQSSQNEIKTYYFIFLSNFCKKFFLANFLKMLRAGGAGLSDEQREEMTNREGVAAGGATQKNRLRHFWQNRPVFYLLIRNLNLIKHIIISHPPLL